MQLAVLMTCFNRKALTLLSLDRLSNQVKTPGVDMQIFLVDDGSTDGTGQAVAERFPTVHLLHGDGSLFWNGGMRKAFAHALTHRFDAYIWFNDDTILYPDAIARIVAAYQSCLPTLGPAIIVGSVRDEVTGLHSYGGIAKRPHHLRLDFVPVPPSEHTMQPCDTMNGNFTLIPAAVVDRLGNLESTFRHQLGDVDYGLRATAAGIPVRVAAGYFGTCSDNSRDGTWRDQAIPFSRRWKNLMSPKGAPVREWLLYTRRHFGWRWPLYAISPYLKTIFRP